MIISIRKRFIFVAVPKCASTSLHRTFLDDSDILLSSGAVADMSDDRPGSYFESTEVLVLPHLDDFLWPSHEELLPLSLTPLMRAFQLRG